MTSPQGPAKEERWGPWLDEPHVDVAPIGIYRRWNGMGAIQEAGADYLNALERERDAYRQTLEEIMAFLMSIVSSNDELWELTYDKIKPLVRKALALSSAAGSRPVVT